MQLHVIFKNRTAKDKGRYIKHTPTNEEKNIYKKIKNVVNTPEELIVT